MTKTNHLARNHQARLLTGRLALTAAALAAFFAVAAPASSDRPFSAALDSSAELTPGANAAMLPACCAKSSASRLSSSWPSASTSPAAPLKPSPPWSAPRGTSSSRRRKTGRRRPAPAGSHQRSRRQIQQQPHGPRRRPAQKLRLLQNGRRQIFRLLLLGLLVPACRAFTPDLVSFYRVFKPAHPNFELIFVNLDRSENDMLDYMKNDYMTWPAIWYADVNNPELEAMKYCSGGGIPCLTLVDADGRVLATNEENGSYRDPTTSSPTSRPL